jgi:hypothetical protein
MPKAVKPPLVSNILASLTLSSGAMLYDYVQCACKPGSCGFDDDLAGQITQKSNRIRGWLTQIHPALERVIGPHLDHPAMLDLIERYRVARSARVGQ